MKIVTRGVGEKVIIDGHTTVTIKAIEQDHIILVVESADSSPPYFEKTVSLNTGDSLIPNPLHH